MPAPPAAGKLRRTRIAPYPLLRKFRTWPALLAYRRSRGPSLSCEFSLRPQRSTKTQNAPGLSRWPASCAGQRSGSFFRVSKLFSFGRVICHAHGPGKSGLQHSVNTIAAWSYASMCHVFGIPVARKLQLATSVRCRHTGALDSFVTKDGDEYGS